MANIVQQSRDYERVRRVVGDRQGSGLEHVRQLADIFAVGFSPQAVEGVEQSVQPGIWDLRDLAHVNSSTVFGRPAG